MYSTKVGEACACDGDAFASGGSQAVASGRIAVDTTVSADDAEITDASIVKGLLSGATWGLTGKFGHSNAIAAAVKS